MQKCRFYCSLSNLITQPAVKKIEVRIEEDNLGQMEVPEQALWGVRTARWLSRARAGAFKYGESKLHPLLLESLCLVQKAKLLTIRCLSSASENSGDVGVSVKPISVNKSVNSVNSLISLRLQVLDELLNGQHSAEIVVDPRLSLCGESLFDNLNEVMTGRSRQLVGLKAHSEADKSTEETAAQTAGQTICDFRGSDYFHLALRLAVFNSFRDIEATLLDLERLLRRQSLSLEKELLLSGREAPEDLQIAEIFSQFGNLAERNMRKFKESRSKLLEMSLSEESVFQKQYFLELTKLTGLGITPAAESTTPQSLLVRSYFQADYADLLKASSSLQELALDINQMCQVLADQEVKGLLALAPDEEKARASLTALKLACLRVQATGNLVGLALNNTASSLAGTALLESSDAIKGALRSCNYTYINRIILYTSKKR
jgi:aspartate ammonia-lyase